MWVNSSNIDTYDGIIRSLGNYKSMVVSKVVEHGRLAIMQYDVSHSRPRGENPLVKHSSEITKSPDRMKYNAQYRYDTTIKIDELITWTIQTG